VEAAAGAVEIDAIEARCNDIFRIAVRKALNEELEPAAMTAFQLAYGQVHDRMTDRQAAPADNPAAHCYAGGGPVKPVRQPFRIRPNVPSSKKAEGAFHAYRLTPSPPSPPGAP
jgi:hypothetical protein